MEGLSLGTAYASFDLRLGRLEAGLAKARQEIDKTGADITKRTEKISRDMSAKFAELGRTMTAAVTLPLVALGGAAIKAAADMDSLKRGLTAVTGSSKEAERQLVRLKEVAKLPGLGFREAVEGSIRLQAAGINAGVAEKALRGFGNALATVGKGKADLDGVLLALSQIASKGKVSAEEINQIAERVPQIRKVMQEAFGTADTELLQKAGISSAKFIEAVTNALGKLPQATGGAKNAFENLKDSADRALTAIGETFLPRVAKAVDGLATSVEEMAGKWKALPMVVKDAVAGTGGMLASIGLIAVAVSGVTKAVELMRVAFSAPFVITVSLVGAAWVLKKVMEQRPEGKGLTNKEVSEFKQLQRRQLLEDTKRMNPGALPELQKKFAEEDAADAQRNIDAAYDIGERGRHEGMLRTAPINIRPMDAAKMAAAAQAAKKAAEDAKRLAKERAEAIQRNRVEMDSFQNKYRGMNTQAQFDYQERLPLLGKEAADAWLAAKKAEIDKMQAEEKRQLDEAQRRRLDDVQNRLDEYKQNLLAIEKKQQDELTKARTEMIQKGLSVANTAALEAYDQAAKERLERQKQILTLELDQLEEFALAQQEAAKKVLPLSPARKDHDIWANDPTLGNVLKDMKNAPLQAAKEKIRNSIGGAFAYDLAGEFANSFGRGLERAFGNNPFGRALSRSLSRMLDKVMDDALESLFSSLAGKKGGLGGIAGPSGIGGGGLGFALPAIGIGMAIGKGLKGLLGFADGGWVPGPTGQARLAVVHGGEHIANPGQMASGAHGGGMTVVLSGDNHFHNDYDVDRLIDRISYRTQRRQAVNPA